jgi:hypothetical protein
MAMKWLREIHNLYVDIKKDEKQGEQEQLYIRFGEIPSNEKSKIYCGEEEVGEEDGVSVYPAFELNGNVVVGLTLPITRTTLYTQQHLLEYDNRPCYLVSGDYVGKGADGEPLIRNISIIKRLENYRIKEQKPTEWSEEDEETLDYIIAYIEKDKSKDKIYTKKTEVLGGMVTWLKSLKDRYTWKPSDEQMKALKHASNDCSIAFADMKILATLYEQLKALHHYEQDT